MSLTDVDWSKLPAPEDDSTAARVEGTTLPQLELAATDGSKVHLADLTGTSVIYIYPKTGQPGVPLPDGWDTIPGARGCTPQSCAFRDHYKELSALGAGHIFGLSTQSTAYQAEAVERLHLPFPLLSDADLTFTNALDLPSFEADGQTLLKRLTLIVRDGVVIKAFYPVFPPDRNAADVMAWLEENPA
ncbi:peroxiredoxin [Roseibium alexandrii]|uniref:Peroxiredoxin n=1 Tax=Roseibium alexandrii (strain DSM 17067 / NCIMB 14079 / DFL-11) TaxID=244592 RepID=A0A5E8H4B7_ROSAD|nr:peroxiredoxin [Roseibium alexandrii]EEE46946.1 Peroxiredoxin [Roseibium alexandrii DFL-11]